MEDADLKHLSASLDGSLKSLWSALHKRYSITELATNTPLPGKYASVAGEMADSIGDSTLTTPANISGEVVTSKDGSVSIGEQVPDKAFAISNELNVNVRSELPSDDQKIVNPSAYIPTNDKAVSGKEGLNIKNRLGDSAENSQSSQSAPIVKAKPLIDSNRISEQPLGKGYLFRIRELCGRLLNSIRQWLR